MTGFVSAPGNERQDARAIPRTFGAAGAWLMGCGLAITVVGGPVWQRLLIVGVVFVAHLGGRWLA